jgi:hypothetical protein
MTFTRKRSKRRTFKVKERRRKTAMRRNNRKSRRTGGAGVSNTIPDDDYVLDLKNILENIKGLVTEYSKYTKLFKDSDAFKQNGKFIDRQKEFLDNSERNINKNNIEFEELYKKKEKDVPPSNDGTINNQLKVIYADFENQIKLYKQTKNTHPKAGNTTLSNMLGEEDEMLHDPSEEEVIDIKDAFGKINVNDTDEVFNQSVNKVIAIITNQGGIHEDEDILTFASVIHIMLEKLKKKKDNLPDVPEDPATGFISVAELEGKKEVIKELIAAYKQGDKTTESTFQFLNGLFGQIVKPSS